ncbi:hypothetical protein HL653_00540 [Sphingomonas sp. AP4-R1]|uniref:hypothetical protein n=1 Tax=Sphingomonas sp. AP4-R1 TaxID=2735134 RepID=UPI001493BB92|nr:hypothetical protein [Sphingomonas sp. AP4-R1]QJU56470.1 hypothetical protein HL653_00540 [Sphingomonas sp. AP4-R1]
MRATDDRRMLRRGRAYGSLERARLRIWLSELWCALGAAALLIFTVAVLVFAARH